MLTYKIDVLETLKEAGYNQTRIYNERCISQSAMQKLRKGGNGRNQDSGTTLRIT